MINLRLLLLSFHCIWYQCQRRQPARTMRCNSVIQSTQYQSEDIPLSLPESPWAFFHLFCHYLFHQTYWCLCQFSLSKLPPLPDSLHYCLSLFSVPQLIEIYPIYHPASLAYRHNVCYCCIAIHLSTSTVQCWTYYVDSWHHHYILRTFYVDLGSCAFLVSFLTPISVSSVPQKQSARPFFYTSPSILSSLPHSHSSNCALWPLSYILGILCCSLVCPIGCQDAHFYCLLECMLWRYHLHSNRKPTAPHAKDSRPTLFVLWGAPNRW